MGSDLVTVIALGLWQALLPGSLVISSQKRDLTWCYALRSRTSISLKPRLAKPALVCQAVVYVSVGDIVTIYHPLLCCCLGQQPETDKVLQNTDFLNFFHYTSRFHKFKDGHTAHALTICKHNSKYQFLYQECCNHGATCLKSLKLNNTAMHLPMHMIFKNDTRHHEEFLICTIFYWQDISLKGFILIKGAEQKSLNYEQCFIKNCCKLQH